MAEETSSNEDTSPVGGLEGLHERLQEMAVAYKLKPGQRLNERDLARQLGVSRTPLREALSRLAAEGFFDFTPGRGYSCRPLEPKQVMDLYGLRGALEREAVGLAADHAPESALAELEEFLQQTGSAYDEHDSKELLKIDEYFHEKIAELAGNEEILRTLKNVNARVRFVRWIDMDKRRSTTQNEHRQILQAIRNRDKEAAQDCIGHHIRQRLDQIKANLKEGLSRIYWGTVE
ncbi:MAG: GntR family transcriptional regulator [Kiritimatiellia bacterium]|nr:GntR family transcriptional regulator [Kiritimatiellia bacterium]